MIAMDDRGLSVLTQRILGQWEVGVRRGRQRHSRVEKGIAMDLREY
jgi:hypothetical protein